MCSIFTCQAFASIKLTDKFSVILYQIQYLSQNLFSICTPLLIKDQMELIYIFVLSVYKLVEALNAQKLLTFNICNILVLYSINV